MLQSHSHFQLHFQLENEKAMLNDKLVCSEGTFGWNYVYSVPANHQQ